MYQLYGAPLNAKTVGGPGKNTLLPPPPLSGPVNISHAICSSYTYILTISWTKLLTLCSNNSRFASSACLWGLGFQAYLYTSQPPCIADPISNSVA